MFPPHFSSRFALALACTLAACDQRSTTPTPQTTAPAAPVAPSTPAAKEIVVDLHSMEKKIPLTGYRPASTTLATDADLLSALDLNRPGLEKVKAAFAAADTAGAIKEFALYLRQRTSPVLVFEGDKVQPVGSPAPSDKRLPSNSQAEQAMRHDYAIAGIRHHFKGPIDWRLNPTTQPGYKGAWSSQFHTQLNRMHHWAALAEAWKETGNPAYLGELLGQLDDWIAKNPTPKMGEELDKFINRYRGSGGGNIRDFPLHLPLDVGQRTTNTCRVLEMIRQTPEVSDEQLIRIVKMLGEHASLLTQLPIDGNHLAIATGGLTAAAVLLPEFKDSNAWLREALTRVTVEMEKQFLPDGAQIELTPWYHYTAVRQFANSLEMMQTNGYQIPEKTTAALAGMYDYIYKIAAPDGFAPALNDAEYLGASVLKRALDFFPEREEYRFFATNGNAGKAPGITSLTIPYAGQAVMRSGWGENALYLLMEYGPFGAGHQHEDKLGLVVNAFGRRLLVDSGRSKYEASVWRDYGINASSHSTVLVDGLFQARRLAKGALNVASEPVPVEWASTPQYDAVLGVYGENEKELFALPTNPPGQVAPEHTQLVMEPKLREDDVQITKRCVHRRHVLFVKPHYWVIVDHLEPGDEAEHRYTTLFQMGPGETNFAGSVLTLGKPGEAGMVLAGAAENATTEPLGLRIVKGQKEPFLLGWQFTNGEPSPIPVALFERVTKGRAIHAYALVPHSANETKPVAPKLEWLPSEAGFSKLRVTPGRDLPLVTVSIPHESKLLRVE